MLLLSADFTNLTLKKSYGNIQSVKQFGTLDPDQDPYSSISCQTGLIQIRIDIQAVCKGYR